jgi:hypothetical protein
MLRHPNGYAYGIWKSCDFALLKTNSTNNELDIIVKPKSENILEFILWPSLEVADNSEDCAFDTCWIQLIILDIIRK